jgi:hypothetical protein
LRRRTRVSTNVHGQFAGFLKNGFLARLKKTFFVTTDPPRFSAKEGGKMSISRVSREIVIQPSQGGSPAEKCQK